MTALKYDIVLERGSYFELKLNYLDQLTNEPVDLDGYSARMQLRATTNSSDVIFELTTANNRLVIDENQITIKILATESAGFSFDIAKYDLEIFPALNEGLAVRLLQGSVILSKDITR
jgi:hypothetical protein